MMGQTPLEGVYERADVRRALAAGDWSATLRAILDSGITQTEVANRTGVSQAQVSLAHQLARDSEGGLRRRIFGAISEIAGLAAWLHADLSEASQARRYYRMAIAAASRSGHPLLPIYMQGSLGQYASMAGDPAQGLRLIREAAGRLPPSAPRIAWAWLCSLEGVALAHLQDRTALAILDQAERHADAAQDDEPVWPWVFHFDNRKIAAHRAIAATRLRMPDLAITYSDKAGSSRSPKQAAVALVERARAFATKGETEQACKLASDAYDIGCRFGSERVRQAVRDLRAERRPAPNRITADLDERLHSSYREDDG